MYPGHLREKNGYYQMVIVYYTMKEKEVRGKKKEIKHKHEKSFSTGLPVKNNKTRAEKMLNELRQTFKPPVEETPEDKTIFFGKLEPKPDDKTEMLFTDHMVRWLESRKHAIKPTTYGGYQILIRVIIQYFRPLGLCLKDLDAETIEEFYDYLYKVRRVKANTVIHYHAVIRKALQQVVERYGVKCNVADQIERPQVEYCNFKVYNEQEADELLYHIRGYLLELPVIMAVYYGLRRSEILGLKWSAVDLTENTITIRHTVTAGDVDGHYLEFESDTTKTKSSKRSLPLVANFRELLLERWNQKEQNISLYRRSYDHTYDDYIFVDEFGKRLKPNRLTQGFSAFLEKKRELSKICVNSNSNQARI